MEEIIIFIIVFYSYILILLRVIWICDFLQLLFCNSSIDKYITFENRSIQYQILISSNNRFMRNNILERLSLPFIIIHWKNDRLKRLNSFHSSKSIIFVLNGLSENHHWNRVYEFDSLSFIIIRMYKSIIDLSNNNKRIFNRLINDGIVFYLIWINMIYGNDDLTVKSWRKFS